MHRKKGAIVILLTVLLLMFTLVSCKSQETEEKKKVDETLTIETDISVEKSKMETSLEIDAMLTAEVESGQYTFEQPLIVQDPYQNCPLTAVVLFQTIEKTKVKATVDGSEWGGEDYSGETSYTTDHRVPVLGMYAGRTNKVLLEMFDETGKKTGEKTIEITTDSLPEYLEDVVEIYDDLGETAMPFILVTGQQAYRSYVFDENGDIRWYLTDAAGTNGIFPISGGKFLFHDKDTMVQTYEKPHTIMMYEMDYLGRTYKAYYLDNGWHHEVIEKEPGGNLMVLSNSIDGHVEDLILELDRETGLVVKELYLEDIFGETYRDRIDWAHLNTIDYDSTDGTVILSPRNLHSAIKVNWETGELIWILCDPDFWEGTEFEDYVLKPESDDIIWHFQQHSTRRIVDMDDDPNTIQLMMYDNHWIKTRNADSFDGHTKSYVTQYTIDEENMTVKQDHLYGGVKSKITSNFVFLDEEERVFSMGGYLDPKVDDNRAMIYEFTYYTEELVNQWALTTTFYRAYEFGTDYSVMEASLEEDSTPTYEALHEPEKTDVKLENLTISGTDLPEGTEIKIVNNVLYIRAKDHTVYEIYLIGEENSYKEDLTATLPGEDTYVDYSYYLLLPLSKLESDTYRLVINYQGEIKDTEKTITIKNEMLKEQEK